MSYQKGDFVYILNTSFSGKLFVEGKARIEQEIDAKDNRYLVKFVSADGERAENFERFVNAAAQRDPQAYCDELNKRINAA